MIQQQQQQQQFLAYTIVIKGLCLAALQSIVRRKSSALRSFYSTLMLQLLLVPS